MRLKKGLLLLLLSSAASPALAGPEPGRAATWDWVRKLPIPEPDAARRSAPVQSLLVNAQTRYGAESDDYYAEYALLIQEPQGLAAGAIAIPWHPDLSDLVIHKVHILRDGKTIDVLAAGQEFMVLRRENNLERAMLDGILTAVLQPEGLTVGDTVNVAFTIRRKADPKGFRSENIQLLSQQIPSERLYLREVWPADRTLRWRASELMPKPKLEKTKFGTELILDAADVVAPDAPDDAPIRFQMPPSLETSEYQSWNEISGIAAPLYASAAELRADSPLRAEIDRIAASTPDAGKRAMAALRLVQDKIRYVALAMGDGGVVPATADQTWSRKYGDCKGKTVTLLALLKGLGIDAEPMLVSSFLGDSLPDRLPLARAFDHVLVRARIDGKDYYLDGTRTGDRVLEELASSPFGSGLPLRAAGSPLEKLPLLPPAAPLNEINITFDASGGFFKMIPVTGELILRGDNAIFARASLAEAGEDEFKKKLRDFTSDLPDAEDLKFEFRDDPDRGTFAIAFAGSQQLEWSGGSEGKSVRFQFASDTISWEPTFEREEGPFKQAPYLLTYPVYIAATETVILPHGGAGFALEGKNLDRSVAGTQITRTLSLAKGRAVSRSTFRRLRQEISATEAAASHDVLKQINGDIASVRAPADYQPSAADKAAMRAKEPNSAAGYNERGYEYLQSGELTKAIADFKKASDLSPGWSRPVGNLAVALIYRSEFDEAEAVLKTATGSGEDDFVVHQAAGMLHFARARLNESVQAFTRSLELKPGNGFTLLRRAVSLAGAGRLQEALADTDRVLLLAPKDPEALGYKVRLLKMLGNEKEALVAVDEWEAATANPFEGLAWKASLLDHFGRRKEAEQTYARALANLVSQIAKAPAADREPLLNRRADLLAESDQTQLAIRELGERLKTRPDSVSLLNSRCWTRVTANVELELALKDCQAALVSEPENAPVMDSLGHLYLRLGRHEEALAAFDKALSWSPRLPAALYGRGVTKSKMGDRTGGESDISRARAFVFDIETRFAGYGIVP